jgi:hypothetical protein
MSKMTVTADAKPMLNAYPDSVGGTLSDITGFLQKPELKDVFSSFYILPSVFNTDLDRGFSVIDYTLNEELADKKDLEALEELGINLKLDFILNHASVLSRQFQDILKNGGLLLNRNTKELLVDGEPVRLTATEYKIMELLMEHPGYVFSAEEIYSQVWQEDAYSVENTVMVHIRRIREKIEITPKNPKYLKVVWGIGYKIEKIDGN